MTITLNERHRFWPRVKQGTDGCWLWIGGTRANGYGSFAVKIDERWTQTTAHRWSYTDLVAPIPTGYEVDHLCRTRNCVRPDHLEAITLAENRRRRDIKYTPQVDRSLRPLPVLPPLPAKPPKRNPETHCRNGHAYAQVGWVSNGPERRTCAACRTATFAKRNLARRNGRAHGTETHCPYGHAYNAENTYVRIRPNGGRQRECRTCVNARNRATWHKRKP